MIEIIDARADEALAIVHRAQRHCGQKVNRSAVWLACHRLSRRASDRHWLVDRTLVVTSHWTGREHPPIVEPFQESCKRPVLSQGRLGIDGIEIGLAVVDQIDRQATEAPVWH